MTWRILNSTLEEWSTSHSGPKFHAVLCDPPYGLEFMGKEWDAPHKATSFPKAGNLGGFADGQKPSFARQKRHLHKLTHAYQQWGEAILPHLHPGAIVLMFGGTRTWHHLAMGMEYAGFEMWDTLMWLYGQGFPKAQDISKLIDAKNGDDREVVGRSNRGSGASPQKLMNHAKGDTGIGMLDGSGATFDVTRAGSDFSAPWSGHKTCALKPAWEPILAFRAPSKQTYAELAMEYGSGCLNVDGGRIPSGADHAEKCASVVGLDSNRNGNCFGEWTGEREDSYSALGRYPANLVIDKDAAVLLDEQSGNRDVSGSAKSGRASLAIPESIFGGARPQGLLHNDYGGASRFFYVAKADRDERDAGLGASFQKRMLQWSSGPQSPGTFQSEGTDKEARNFHPTVKPLSLAKWLATLLLPPKSVSPRRILIPFAGSGTEVIGAYQAGWDEITAIEQDAEYCRIAEARVSYWKSLGVQESLFNQPSQVQTGVAD